MAYHRSDRIAGEIKKQVSKIINDDVKDPRISEMLSITRVEVTRDIRYAKIYVSVLGDEEEKNATIEGLENAKGYIRNELGHILKIRYTPELKFILDNSIEYSIDIAKKLAELKQGDE
ncbi:MAG: 30S ribosome-binding factor RbfA [Xylanivirga thermophila]|jgi:ribosome-binding factor A|uniref:30S ribosome-binding factor RbfA n=1 Tax=Xylanivirga thermophila TaxID=2496273 RepID=UPI00101D1C4A|nr:30S ribosome-binding factor RbfA [Xylanivirga thermophila]